MILSKDTRRDFLYKLMIALAIFASAHAFCFANLSLRGDSLLLNSSKLQLSLAESGCYLAPYYLNLRGAVASPYMIGIISFGALFVTVLFLSDLLELRRLLPFALLCCILMLSPAVLSGTVSTLITFDSVCLSLMLGCAAVYLQFKKPALFPIAAVLFVLSFGLYPGHYSFLICIALLSLLEMKISGKSMPPAKTILLQMGVFIISFLIYAAGFLFICRHYDYEANLSVFPQGSGSWAGSLLAPFVSALAPVTAYPIPQTVIRLILFAVCITLAIWQFRKHGIHGLCLMILLLLAMALPFPFGTAPQFVFAFSALDLLVLLLCTHMQLPKRFQHVLCIGASILCLGIIVFANQVYLRINLDFDQTLSVITRVLARIETTEGFDLQGQTKVALIGSLSDSPLIADRPGFEHLKALHALEENSALTRMDQNTYYLWETLGYPLNCASDYECWLLSQEEAVQSMPVFPAAQSCQFVGDTLVVRLSL